MRALVCILKLPERDPTRLLANVDGADPLAAMYGVDLDRTWLCTHALEGHESVLAVGRHHHPVRDGPTGLRPSYLQTRR